MRIRILLIMSIIPLFCLGGNRKVSTADIDWPSFLAQHDMYWDELTTDPEGVTDDFNQRRGYYTGALMGNGLLGLNMYKLRDDVYRLNVGRSDVTMARSPFSLYNSGRLPIGYFTLATVGHVTKEKMRLSLYDAQTKGCFTTDKGAISFLTYVHACKNVMVMETEAEGQETNYEWDFVPLKAVSPTSLYMPQYVPPNYLNREGKANPDAVRTDEGDFHFVVQPLATDSTFATIARSYVVAWLTMSDGPKRRILATVTQQEDADEAVNEARMLLQEAARFSSKQLAKDHLRWWHDFYPQAAFLSFPDALFESYYWAQYYKFASTARPGFPIVDLQGVWPSWDTPWPAVWMNLNIQLTYSWQTKANLAMLAQPLWDALYDKRENLTRNVTDIHGQEAWTDAAVLPRTCTYDFHEPLQPYLAQYNAYEVGNLAWTLHYYWLQCNAYGDKEQMSQKLFPLLKSAINLFFHIRIENPDGTYSLPPTASPEYNYQVGKNTNYDLANLRQGLITLLRVDSICEIHDPMVPQWKDFLNRLVDYQYDPETGFMVSENLKFDMTNHRHYSHLFMIYPYHHLSWDVPEQRSRMELSIDRWQGDQGYSHTGKAAMLTTIGRGDEAADYFDTFLNDFLMPNTLYAEYGPVIETPLSGLTTLHDFYMQDWGDRIRIFNGTPSRWPDASFIGMRAQGAFLVSAVRKEGNTAFVQIESENGGVCRIQTSIPMDKLKVCKRNGRSKAYSLVDAGRGCIEVKMEKGETIWLQHRDYISVRPRPILHLPQEAMPFGQDREERKPKKAHVFA